MQFEETQNLRKALMATALIKKGDKLQQKIQHKLDGAIKEWEFILFDYINATTELNILTQMAEQQKKIINLRKILKQCTKLIKMSTEHFDTIWELVDLMLPMSMVSGSWMENILKHEERLGQMKEALAPLLLFSCNREVIEIVQKMMLQITEIQTKINFLAGKVREAIQDTFKFGSNVINNKNQLNNHDISGTSMPN